MHNNLNDERKRVAGQDGTLPPRLTLILEMRNIRSRALETPGHIMY